MFKYKETESPTMELAPGIRDHEIIKRCFQFCQISSIERLIININEENIKEVSFIQSEIELYTDICVFFRCSIHIYSFLKERYYGIPFILIIDSIEDISFEQYDLTSLFFELTYNGTVDDRLDSVKSAVIWNVPFSEYHWNAFDNAMGSLIQFYNDSDLMIKQIVLTKTLIIEHPCNVYLCSSSHCHSNHGSFPRSLYISINGRVFPYSIEDARLCIGNIMTTFDVFFDEYENSEAKANFIKLNREVYLDTIDKCCYELIPWFELIKGKLDEC